MANSSLKLSLHEEERTHELFIVSGDFFNYNYLIYLVLAIIITS